MISHLLQFQDNYVAKVVLIFMLFILSINAFGQEALVSNGGSITVVGPGGQNGNLGIAVLGNFINLNDGTNDGSIELSKGHIFVTGDWTNNANNNVFTTFSGTNADGFVTLSHPNTLQLIAGTSPTFFENLTVTASRKMLAVDNCSVNGSLFVDATFELDANTFIINNPSPAGIVYQSGFIKSETMPGTYSSIRWIIGSSIASYEIPFGSDNFSVSNDLNLKMEILSSMNVGDFIDFATYPTDRFNFPLPTGATALETEAKKVVDRFWIIKTSDPLVKPASNITFTYTSDDANPAFNSINPQHLKASRDNTTIGEWLDMAPRGISVGKTVEIQNVTPTELFDSWTLLNLPGPLTDLFAPDAFSPNGDGVNDKFFPVFQEDFEVIQYDLYIYNRWGLQVFHTTSQTEGWDGRDANSTFEPQIGVYTWVIIVKGRSKYNLDAEGEVKRHVGRVTLVR